MLGYTFLTLSLSIDPIIVLALAILARVDREHSEKRELFQSKLSGNSFRCFF